MLLDSGREQFPIKVVYPVPTDFSRSLMLVYKDRFSHRLHSKLLTILPNLSLSIKPISALKIVSTPLTRFLTQKASSVNTGADKPRGFESGFLTMD